MTLDQLDNCTFFKNDPEAELMLKGFIWAFFFCLCSVLFWRRQRKAFRDRFKIDASIDA